MAGLSDRQTLKREAILALDQARNAMHRDVRELRSRWNLGDMLQQSVKKHRIAVMIGAGVVGLATIKILMPSRENRRDTLPKSAKKRTLFSFLLAGVWGMAREPLIGLASQQLLPVVMQYVSQLQSSPKNPISK